MKRFIDKIRSARYFMIGWFRKVTGIVPEYVYEQAVLRYLFADIECKENGVCKCGCDLWAMCLSGKNCDWHCYPRMLTKKEWYELSFEGEVNIDDKECIMIKRIGDNMCFIWKNEKLTKNVYYDIFQKYRNILKSKA